MGFDQSRNAGGFAYMQIVTCPLCGARRHLGRENIENGFVFCPNRAQCDRRRKEGKYLHRLERKDD